MTAQGIHDHPTKKLGLSPSDPNKPVLALKDFLTGVVPPHPLAVDHTNGVTPGLYRNDAFGVCGPTMMCNDRRLISTRAGHYTPPSQDDCFNLYRASGNPNFDPNTGADDNGVDMKTMMNAALKNGIGGVKPLGFASVDVTNRDEMQAAVDIFGSLHIAVDLKVAQQATSDAVSPFWDYKAGSGEWGGHAILVVKFNPSEDDVWSWAELIRMTVGFEQHQLQEAYVVIWPEHDANPALYEAIDMPHFAGAYTAITNGRPYPGRITPPTPGPTPTPVPPTPAPGGGASFQVTAEVAAHVAASASRMKVTEQAWMDHHWATYFHLGG